MATVLAQVIISPLDYCHYLQTWAPSIPSSADHLSVFSTKEKLAYVTFHLKTPQCSFAFGSLYLSKSHKSLHDLALDSSSVTSSLSPLPFTLWSAHNELLYFIKACCFIFLGLCAGYSFYWECPSSLKGMGNVLFKFESSEFTTCDNLLGSSQLLLTVELTYFWQTHKLLLTFIPQFTKLHVTFSHPASPQMSPQNSGFW